jgi:hypothetical protein
MRFSNSLVVSSWIRKLGLALAALTMAAAARADFTSEYFTSANAPAQVYVYTAGSNLPTQLGKWTVQNSFNAPASQIVVNTFNVPAALTLSVDVESVEQGSVQSHIFFSFTAEADTLFSFENLSILADQDVSGNGSAQWYAMIYHSNSSLGSVFGPGTTASINTGPMQYSILTGETLSFRLLAGALSWPKEGDGNWAYQSATMHFTGLSMSELTAIPEPGSVAAIAGMSVLGFVLWRRRLRS